MITRIVTFSLAILITTPVQAPMYKERPCLPQYNGDEATLALINGKLQCAIMRRIGYMTKQLVVRKWL